MTVRTRIAPSPTGMLHVGTARTALFNFLFAKHAGGSFLLRIDDTDKAREVEGAVESITEGLAWLSLIPDEPILVQSKRLPVYRAHAETLRAAGRAYFCYCTAERLEALKGEQRARKEALRYDGECRSLSLEKQKAKLAQNPTPAVRFRAEASEPITFIDGVRGSVSFAAEELDDFVIIKGDGYPSYNFATVVDDHEMAITHILRGEDVLSTTPRQLLLYAALGFRPPEFYHLPIILGPDRSKLSKRHGAADLLEYRSEGFLPEALVNFLALLGWSAGDDRELFTLPELIALFDPARIQRHGAIFDREKLLWMNGEHIRQLETEDFAERLRPYLEERGLPVDTPEPTLITLGRLYQERTKSLGEAAENARFFFSEPGLLPSLFGGREDGALLEAAAEALQALRPFEHRAIEEALRAAAAERGTKPGAFFKAIRSAITGTLYAPPLFETIELLGKETVLRRIKAAQTLLGK